MHLSLLARFDPVRASNTRLYVRRPYGYKLSQGLNLAVRVGEARLEQPLLRLRYDGHFPDRHSRSTVRIEHQWLLVEKESLALGCLRPGILFGGLGKVKGVILVARESKLSITRHG